MNTKLLKNLILVLVVAIAFKLSAQENFDFTTEDCSVNKFSGAQATLTCDANGFNFTDFATTFFELRINSVTTQDQNRVVINFTNSSNADGIYFKASGQVLEEGAVTDLGSNSVEVVLTDTKFTNGGDIQLRSRFVNKAGEPLTGSVLVTSLVVDDQGVLSTSDLFLRSNTIITVQDSEIVVKNAPEGSALEIYNLLGQKVENINLSSGAYIVRLTAQNTVMSKKIILF
ncbi:T9SS type A sorting domain-containing protein [Algibacter mikhailovii]|uniref:T9SS type A sorting domain-containing protein n=1 Tax=Algibacter mikhailovii TaxID=425498 RepID=UPI002494716C|nr:T9SS type A sorting domain-containing protein [Algibacter mikhailovii]